MFLEIMVLNDDGVTPLTGWIPEEGVIMPSQVRAGDLRLSGAEIRNHLYFVTAPGSSQLYVAQKKNDAVSQLPVV